MKNIKQNSKLKKKSTPAPSSMFCTSKLIFMKRAICDQVLDAALMRDFCKSAGFNGAVNI